MDDDDKVRRNLMVSSSLVLLFAWFDLPPNTIAKRIFGEDLSVSIEPWKLWLPLVLLMAYQIIRYWGVSKSTTEWGSAGGHLTRQRHQKIERLAVRELDDFRRGWKLRYLCGRAPMRYDRENWAHFEMAQIDFSSIQVVLGIEQYSQNDAWYATLVLGGEKGLQVRSDMPRLYFDVPVNRRWIYDLQILVSLVATEYFAEFIVPATISYTALLVTCYRLSSASVFIG